MKLAYRLSAMLALLMAAQAMLGLALPDLYRDVGFVRETWLGNDLVTLMLGVPVLIAGLWLERCGSLRGRLLWFGAVGYSLYNYAFYLLGAALSVFFPLYIVLFVLSGVVLILALSHTAIDEVAARFSPRTPVKLIGGYLVIVAVGLTAMWLMTWGFHVFGGQPTPIEAEAFRLVAALDLAVTVPALLAGGTLLWRRSPWGYVIAMIVGVKSSLYLILLLINSVFFIQRKLVEAPGEVPMWGTLAVATCAATSVLLASAQARRR